MAFIQSTQLLLKCLVDLCQLPIELSDGLFDQLLLTHTPRSCLLPLRFTLPIQLMEIEFVLPELLLILFELILNLHPIVLQLRNLLY